MAEEPGQPSFDTRGATYASRQEAYARAQVLREVLTVFGRAPGTADVAYRHLLLQVEEVIAQALQQLPEP